jgi:hypothetical protein
VARWVVGHPLPPRHIFPPPTPLLLPEPLPIAPLAPPDLASIVPLLRTADSASPRGKTTTAFAAAPRTTCPSPPACRHATTKPTLACSCRCLFVCPFLCQRPHDSHPRGGPIKH